MATKDKNKLPSAVEEDIWMEDDAEEEEELELELEGEDDAEEEAYEEEPEEDEETEEEEPEEESEGLEEESAEEDEEEIELKTRAGFRILPSLKSVTYLNALIYGPAGTGKTTIAATSTYVPQMKDVLLLSAESGHMSISHMEGIDVVPISKFNELAKILQFIKAHVKARDAGDLKMLARLQKKAFGYPDNYRLKKSEIRQYRTVIVDSLTEIHRYGMYKALNMEIGDFDLDDEMEQASFKDWGQVGEQIRYLIRSLRDLPIHSISIAGQTEISDDTKHISYQPMLPGRLSTEVAHFLDFVGYMAVKSGPATEDNPSGMIRRVYYQPNDKISAKTRIQGFPSEGYFTNPTMADIVAPLLR